MSISNLHVSCAEKFLPDFIELVNKNFRSTDHEFWLFSGVAQDKIPVFSNVHLVRRRIIPYFLHYVKIMLKMQTANKIFLHGLFDIKLIFLLFLMPWLLPKCYWIIWGGDLHIYEDKNRNTKWKINEYLRQKVVRKMGHLVTFIEGDVVLARKWYRSSGVYHECIMYPSNLYRELALPKVNKNYISILVGNSADIENNHEEVLAKLADLDDQNFEIVCPLSYGSKEHSTKVTELGYFLFGTRFHPLLEFLEFSEYLKVLNQVDIAIFAHKRQQAMGNTISILGLGKTVYMRNDVTPFKLFNKMNITVLNLNNLNNLNNLKDSVLSDEVSSINKGKVKSYFSEKILIEQLLKIFEA